MNIRINEPAPNWCRTCGRRPDDPMAALCLDTHHRTLERQPAKPEAVRLRDELRERAEFEAWANGRDLTRTRAGEYLSCWVQNDWETWQAALAATGKQQVGEVQGLDVLAEKLVSDWQADGRMQPHAWDYRGFAKDAMTRVLAARQPDMQKPYAPEGYSIISDHQLAHLRERAEVQLRIGGEEVWHWMGDGHDFPESLTCPVIMSAATLRALIAARQPVWQEPVVYDAGLYGSHPYFECTPEQWELHTKGMTEKGERLLANMLAHHCLLARRDDRGWIITRFDLIRSGKPWWHVSNEGVLTYDYDPDTKARAVAAPPAQAVDLGQFRDVIEKYRDSLVHRRWDADERAKAARLLAMIDGQA